MLDSHNPGSILNWVSALTYWRKLHHVCVGRWKCVKCYACVLCMWIGMFVSMLAWAQHNTCMSYMCVFPPSGTAHICLFPVVCLCGCVLWVPSFSAFDLQWWCDEQAAARAAILLIVHEREAKRSGDGGWWGWKREGLRDSYSENVMAERRMEKLLYRENRVHTQLWPVWEVVLPPAIVWHVASCYVFPRHCEPLFFFSPEVAASPWMSTSSSGSFMANLFLPRGLLSGRSPGGRPCEGHMTDGDSRVLLFSSAASLCS